MYAAKKQSLQLESFISGNQFINCQNEASVFSFALSEVERNNKIGILFSIYSAIFLFLFCNIH